MSEFSKLVGRVVNLLRSAVLHRVDDSTGVQGAQVTSLEDEDDDAIPHAQPYGMSFVPPADAEGYVASVGSDASNRVAMFFQKRDARPKDAKEGEGGLYRLDGTWAVFVDEDGTLHLGQMDPDDAVARASVTDSRLDALESKLNDLITKFNTHTQPTSMGPAGPPTVTETPLTPGSTTASQTVKVQS